MLKILKFIGIGIVGVFIILGCIELYLTISEEDTAVNWNTNFSEQSAIPENTKLCVQEMKKIDDVKLARGTKANPADIMSNPATYMGKVIEFPAIVQESEPFPQNSNAAKAFGGDGHIVVAKAEDGTMSMELRKGVIQEMESGVGAFTVVRGMVAGIMDSPNGKVLVIVGNPK